MAAANASVPTDEKTQKYDRQLRLWGEHGQKALEGAKIALLNGGATGSEIMKNLVLPGIGSFTVIDGNKVEPRDLGNNFFVEATELGKPRAEVVARLLNELNTDDVKSSSLVRDPVDVINTNIDYFGQFTLVIATDIPEAPLRKLAAFLYERNIPLIIARAFGLIGALRLVVRDHPVVETKPDNPPEDLRISEPWDELKEFAMMMDFSSMESTMHGHTPFIVILIQAAEKWRSTHGNKAPSTAAERNEFKALIKSWSRSPKEENFPEAINKANKAFEPVTIPSTVRELFAHPAANQGLSAQSANFWVLVAALREFVNNEGGGKLPLNGAIPDMTADTNRYIALQTIYNTKAQKDLAAFTARVDGILARIGRKPGSIPTEEIRVFAKNAAVVRHFSFRTLEEELGTVSPAVAATIRDGLADVENNLLWYVMLRAADRFFAEHGRFPGAAAPEPDVEPLRAIAHQLLKEYEVADVPAGFDDAVRETCRFGGSTMHNIAAFIGGVGSQEAIKLITHQYEPVNNTFIYNGMNCTCTVAEL